MIIAVTSMLRLRCWCAILLAMPVLCRTIPVDGYFESICSVLSAVEVPSQKNYQ